MFTPIVARTFRLARHAWARTVLANLAALLVGLFVVAAVLLAGRALLGGSIEAIADDTFTSADSGRLLVFGVPLFLLLLSTCAWLLLVAIRAVSGQHDLRAALLGSITSAWRVLPLSVLMLSIQVTLLSIDTSGITLLLATIALSVPVLAAIGQVALDPDRWGLGLLWRRGILRAHRNIGAYLAVVLVLVLDLAIVATLLMAPVLLLAGPPPGDLFDTAVLEDWLDDATLGVVLGTVLACIPALTLPAALIVAVYEAQTGALDHTRWKDEDDEPYTPRAELSPVVQQLVGTAPHAARRFVLPPRAAEPGRVPGPGVLNVAGVDLPTGRATRSVEAATLELAVGDGSPGATTHDEQLWISSDARADTPALWRRLAAGFAETGLWPLAIPVAGTTGSVDWFEHATGREADAIDPEADALAGRDVADRIRERLSESLDGGSPLRSTDLLRASHVARGELMHGQGRRTDALTFAFEAIGAARLALAPARRPGDVLHALAWPGAAAAGIPSDELAEIVASWEERYAALLVGLGEGSLVFAVLRPPSTLDEAVEVVAEHHALCPDEALAWGDDLSAAEQLVDEPVWRLSWH